MNASEQHKRVLLIVGGGIAAYKALELIRLLTARHIAVTPLLTKAGAQFVTPMALAALAGEKVHDELFSLTDEVEMGHIALSRAADLIVVAPATADLMARAAAGLADDLATTVLLATDKPVLMAPAMNVRMWEHPATRRNAARLAADGIAFIGPEDGDMACGEQGPGRMSEPEAIAARIVELLADGGPAASNRPLRGRTVLITAGPTREPIDAVRYISNRSSGKQGYALAAAARDLGAEVMLISGPVRLPPPAGVRVIAVQTADEMLQAVRDSLPADVGIFAAAVADWRVKSPHGAKLKKADGPPAIDLEPNPDILATIAADPNRPSVVVGFAAETDDLLAEARRKLREKGCDLIVANDVGPHSGTFGGDANQVTLIGPDGAEHWPRLPKREVARRLMRRIATMLAG